MPRKTNDPKSRRAAPPGEWPGLPMMIQITTSTDRKTEVQTTYSPDSVMALEPGTFVITLELHEVKEAAQPGAKRFGIALATIWEMELPAPATTTTQEESTDD